MTVTCRLTIIVVSYGGSNGLIVKEIIEKKKKTIMGMHLPGKEAPGSPSEGIVGTDPLGASGLIGYGAPAPLTGSSGFRKS